MTGHIVLAVAPGTAERAIDTAFALAAERGSTLLAVRTWHDPDLPLGGWFQPDRTARWDAISISGVNCPRTKLVLRYFYS